MKKLFLCGFLVGLCTCVLLLTAFVICLYQML